MAIKRPLDRSAVGAADDKFYKKYPEMIDENGNRIPLDASNDPDNDMHEDWVRFYKEELESGGSGPDDNEETAKEGVGFVPPPPEGPNAEFPTTPPDPCQTCAKSWISLDLNYEDGKDCIGVRYSALTTAAYEQPTTTAAPKRWTDIPAGTCLFGEFDYHATGAAAEKPDF